METSQAGVDLIKKFEGCKLSAYTCPAGVLTIGVGSTGPHVKPGMVITQDAADALLKKDLKRFELAVNGVAGDHTTQNQFDAMVSLAFNIGVSAFRSSTVARKHKAKNYEGAAEAFRMWNKAGGKVLIGLVKRREAESVHYMGK